MIFPIITIPYITRVLGSNELGIFAFTDSVIQYFILIGTIGINLYASRQIAYSRDNKEERSHTFWEITSMRNITVAISLFVFYIILFFADVQYKKMYFIQSINLVAFFLDPSWLFVALEDFQKILTRNLIVRGLGYAGLFLLIKDKNDLALYALLIAMTNIIGNFVVTLYVPKYVNKIKIQDVKNSFKHFMPCLALFIPQVAVQVYTILDKTMLGIFSIPSEVAYYDMSQKLARIALSIITAISLTLLPRISHYFSKGDNESIKTYTAKSFNFALYLALPIMFGLVAISNDFVPWFLGPDFLKVKTLLNFTALLVPIVAASSIFGQQLMIPMKKEKEYTISVVIGALLNFVLNLFLIPKIHSVGACIASVIAETIIAFYQFYVIKDFLPLKELFFEAWKYLLSASLMFLVIKQIGNSMNPVFVTTFVQVSIGLVIYFFMQHILNSKIQILLVNKLLQITKIDKLIKKGT